MEARRLNKDLRGPAWCMLGHALCMTVLPLLALIAALMIRIWPELSASFSQAVIDPAAVSEKAQELVLRAVQEGDWYETLVSLLNVGCAILSLIPFAIYGARRQVNLSLAPREVTIKRVLSLIVMAMCVNGLAGFANIPVEWLFNRAGYTILWDFPLGDTATAKTIMTVYAVVLAPVIEEILFRGYLLGGLRRYGDRFAVVSSALLFGLMHGNLSQFLSALCIGLLLGYARVRYGSLLVCMFAHAGNNLLALGLDLLPDWTSLIVMLALIGLGVPLLRRLLREKGELSDPAELQAQRVGRRLWLNVPMVIYLLVALRQFAAAVLPLG